RLLGTAGMIGVAGALHGELWLPLERETEFVSELELPRVRGVLRSTHRVRPRRRWTLYTATAVDAGSLQAGARPGDPLVAGAGVAALRESGIGLNPLPREPAPEFLDHDAFLELGAAAADLEAQQGIPLSAIALDSTGLVGRLASAALMLAGSNIRCVAVREEPVSRALFRVESPDGSAVTVIALPAGGSPGDLGFPNGAGEMARRLERWLDAVIPLAGDDGAAVGLVLGTNADEGLRAVAAVTEWNSRFAYPKIVSGQLDELLARLQREPGTTTAGRRPLTPSDTPPTPPGRKGVDGNEGVRQRRVELVIAPLVSRLSTAASGLAAVAQQFSFRVPGTLVFNPTPFVRTDVAVMPDGTERIVTDVPPMGYACVPYPGYRLDAERLGRPGRDAGGRWQEIPGSGNEISIESQYFRVGLDPETGAIRSLVARASGREWVRPRSAGLNANAGVGFRLGQLVKHRNPGVGTRITAERRLSSGPGWRSTVTVYDQLPWVDISNEADPDATPLDALAFAFGLERPTVAWEIPAGHERSPAPVDRLVHLRWLTLTAGEDVVFFRGLETPATAVADDGSLRSLAPPRRARYRLAFASGFTAPDDPWRFGWGTEPLA
ncbi:MAG TPA: hypothetical protein VK132_12585, partial [Gemmatimonadales bacterium]|nr:hypothetical protein [Gemmatimonadales bacterium]